jgi:response regulator RpfG family c-di-GMP phosphodiesterase
MTESIDGAQQIPTSEADANTQPVVLCVDDEERILTSIKRALRKQPYQLLFASNGADALQLMEENHIDVVMSDMRMPGMSGAELLESVHARWPDTVRILLTGYSDMASTVAAINKGRIYRYLSKPWKNEDLLTSIASGLEFKLLRDEIGMLTKLTEAQNEALKRRNDDLEAKVEARTAEIANAAKLLRRSFNQLKEGYKKSITVFTHLIELREGQSSMHGQNVASLAEIIGKELGLDEDALSDLNNAAMLHDIGKLGFTDDLVATPYYSLNEDQLETYQTHPKIGQATLLSIPTLDKTGEIILAHHEHYDGGGFPNKLIGDAIPVESRILAIASDFDDLQKGIFLGEKLTPVLAAAYIKSQSGSRYDPKIVNIFSKLLDSMSIEVNELKELKVNHNDLKPGMILSRNILSVTGLLLLKKDQVLSAPLISRLRLLVGEAGASNIVFISGLAINNSGEKE